MAARKVEACMYCELTPCGCNKVEKPAKKVVKKIPPPTAVAIPPAPAASSKPALSTVRSIRPAADVDFEKALTVLAEAGMLHPDELIKHRSSIRLTDQKIKLLMWKYRHWEARQT